MTFESFKKKIIEIQKSVFGVQLYFFFGNNGIFRVEMEDLFEKSLIDDVKIKLNKFIKNDNQEISHINYADDDLANTWYFLDNNYDDLDFINFNYQDCVTYKFTPEFPTLNLLKGFIFVVGNDQNNFVAYRNHAPINLLSRKTWHIIFKSRQRFTEAPEDTLRFTTNFDFMLVNQRLLVFNLSLLERSFGYKAIIEKKARANISIIEASGLITSSKLLYSALDDSSLAKKLMRIKKDCPVLKLNNKKVIHFSKTNPKLKGLFRYSISGKQIDISSKRAARQFIKLLNDDFLHSQLTNMDYEVKSKIPWNY